MIMYNKGNLLESDAEAVVNTVNTVGVMGKGIALQFKRAFPENFRAYERACKHGEVQLGRMFVYETNTLHGPRFIINFPTKRHWKESSRLADIRAGLRGLIESVQKLKIKSIAIPPLGCGLGGLDWNEVCPLIEKAFEPLQEVEVILYAPAGVEGRITVCAAGMSKSIKRG